ncbi:hypothetical protein [Thiocapsa sp.]|uniref:hypothetical protein n=1 Tax=Thiocapsa sp. TaxID=2024551 RepID=UPI0026113BB6|nr:hypothetical protein [Thiocapsa sp.]
MSAPQLLDRVEALQPPFRKRVYTPTETLAMFMTQALSEDGSCRAVVNAAAVRRALDGDEPSRPTPVPIAKPGRACRCR